jgi:hypothetical protein
MQQVTASPLALTVAEYQPTRQNSWRAEAARERRASPSKTWRSLIRARRPSGACAKTRRVASSMRSAIERSQNEKRSRWSK